MGSISSRRLGAGVGVGETVTEEAVGVGLAVGKSEAVGSPAGANLKGMGSLTLAASRKTRTAMPTTAPILITFDIFRCFLGVTFTVGWGRGAMASMGFWGMCPSVFAQPKNFFRD